MQPKTISRIRAAADVMAAILGATALFLGDRLSRDQALRGATPSLIPFVRRIRSSRDH